MKNKITDFAEKHRAAARRSHKQKNIASSSLSHQTRLTHICQKINHYLPLFLPACWLLAFFYITKLQNSLFYGSVYFTHVYNRLRRSQNSPNKVFDEAIHGDERMIAQDDLRPDHKRQRCRCTLAIVTVRWIARTFARRRCDDFLLQLEQVAGGRVNHI